MTQVLGLVDDKAKLEHQAERLAKEVDYLTEDLRDAKEATRSATKKLRREQDHSYELGNQLMYARQAADRCPGEPGVLRVSLVQGTSTSKRREAAAAASLSDSVGQGDSHTFGDGVGAAQGVGLHAVCAGAAARLQPPVRESHRTTRTDQRSRSAHSRDGVASATRWLRSTVPHVDSNAPAGDCNAMAWADSRAPLLLSEVAYTLSHGDPRRLRVGAIRPNSACDAVKRSNTSRPCSRVQAWKSGTGALPQLQVNT
jgi:hypothetical protein